MIRKAILIVLTLGTIGTVAVSLLSYRGPLFITSGDKDEPSAIFGVYDCRCLWIALPHPEEMYMLSGFPDWTAHPNRQRSFFIEQYTGVGEFPLFVLFPAWFPALLFAAYPTFAFIRGPLRRYRCRKHGLYLKCGYDSAGNV